MKQIHPWLKYSLVLGYVLVGDPVFGQIVPDATLRVNSSVTQSSNKFTINGGTVVGGNLFHSFQHFNVPTGGEAFFNNASTIENIFTRVTGGSISNIDGILRANGSANLFLLNPSGIIFGPNASLNIGGSFIGSSANSIKFIGGSEFSATNPSAPPLLTVSVPIGLQFGSNPGSITNRSTATSSSGQIVGLQVQPSRTLGLVGDTLLLPGGYLTAPSGRIELGSVGSSSFVSITPTNLGFAFGYADGNNLQNIQLSGAASVNASGAGGGNIQVQGRQVSVRDGSQMIAQTQGSQPGGTLFVRASESVELSGTAPDPSGKTADGRIASGLFTTTVGKGNAGSAIIDTGRLIVGGGALVNTSTFGAGSAGNVTVNASNAVEVDAIPYTDELFTRVKNRTLMFSDLRNGIWTQTYNLGNGGDISISTVRLIVHNGAQVNSGSAGTGNAGFVRVNARDLVEVSGVSAYGQYSTLLFSGTRGTGAGNELTVETKQLILRDGGELSSGTTGGGAGGPLTVNALELVELTGGRTSIASGAGLIPFPGVSGKDPAGKTTINTKQLIVRDGAQIYVATGGAGAGGFLTVNASDSVEVKGVSSDGKLISGILGDARDAGDAGSVSINTDKLIVSDKGKVAVNSTGTGKAGNVEIVARSLWLNNSGIITAATTSGEGGNIILKAQDLRLRNNGSITATAGGTGNGGNITIDTDTLLALDSHITANAKQGFGGRVIINTEGIFCTQYQITASSALGADFNGVVQFDTPDVDKSAAVVALPATVIEPTHQITAGCAAQKGNNFVVTGRGGLPSDPTSTLRGATLWTDLRRVLVGSGEEIRERLLFPHGRKGGVTPPLPIPDSPIVEATGWVVDEHGLVELVAQAKESSQHQPWQKTTDCGNL